jgi:dinuclear metal center YbgI/SA1388 family protein
VPSLADVIRCLEELYEPAWAEPWDAVGLVCGDPAADVQRVLFAVDPVGVVAAEAVEWGADLVVAHHPLFLRGVHGVPATTPKGRVVHALLTGGIALYVAHTNADVANPGVSDALARALGLTPIAPLVRTDATGEIGTPGAGRGLGRVCKLDVPEPLSAFVERVRNGLPATAQGIRVAGDRDRVIRTVAVAGGAGDDNFDAARAAGVDVYLTADLRHHPASESRQNGDPVLVDVAHWSSEWPWLGEAAALLRERLAATGDTVEIRVSRVVTDPWSAHFAYSTAHPDLMREQP